MDEADIGVHELDLVRHPLAEVVLADADSNGVGDIASGVPR